RAIALALMKDGFTVFGTSRRPEDRAELTKFQMLALDVRSDDSVRVALQEIRSSAGRLDVLVNNAGIRFLGAAEETSVDEAKAVFETNFFGAHRVTAAALPLLREAGRGRIVNITSLSGLYALPFGSVYSASKWALEAYSESLRHEVKQLGIHVSIVEPGAIHSETREAPQRPKDKLHAYEGARQRALDVIVRGDQPGIDPPRVPDSVAPSVPGARARLRGARRRRPSPHAPLPRRPGPRGRPPPQAAALVLVRERHPMAVQAGRSSIARGGSPACWVRSRNFETLSFRARPVH